MKFFFTFSLFTFFNLFSFSQDLSYYLPDSIQYDPSVPKPQDVIYHAVGEWHVTHDKLVNYMQVLAKAVPSRVKIETMGFTYEGRPQVLLIFTSPKNHQNLEQIRQQHVQLTDPQRSSSLNIDDMPVVLYIGHSIHGNEPSGSNASLLSAYYLAAGQGKQIDDLLDQSVILFDPSLNPDGLQRFSTWVNQHKSKNLVTDPNSREFNEVWPGGRFNHYWFDLNRDWLPAVHPESQNRLTWFHKWKPNVLTDHHEQGSNATFFFQPGVPSRVNPLTPAKNQELTQKMANYHAAYLDRIGSLYFTKENYDDFYYGKGSTYPDINGAVGILFEQGSSRGHAQQTSNGLLTFPFTIRNQFVTTLSTMEASKQLRKELLSFQRDFYKASISEAASASVKAYVFGDEHDQTKTQEFITMLQRHQIAVFQLVNNIKSGGLDFQKQHSYIVPTSQGQHRLIRAIFEKTFNYQDSLFYDITSWTMPLAYGLKYAELNASQFNNNLLGAKHVTANTTANFSVPAKSSYAYLIEWTELYAPAALYELLHEGVTVRVASNPFSMQVGGATKNYSYGTLIIPVQTQTLEADKVFSVIQNISKKYALPVQSFSSGTAMSGSDLGSSRFLPITKPAIAMITGTGVNALDAGEFWHLMDQRMNIPVSHLETGVFNRVDISKYNTLVFTSGNFNEINKEKLRTWVQGGGNLILLEEAVSWAVQAGFNNATLKKATPAFDTSAHLPYIDREQIVGAQAVRGAIFKADVDLTHPLGYGYITPTVSLFKSNKVFMEKSKNPFATPYYYKANPLESGWVSRQNLNSIKNSAAVVVSGLGSGKIISIADNPNFRGYWLGGTKLMMNAIFFGKMINTSSGITED
ncbi:MAG: zinc carboxypeptidase [Flavisolibacter sp.]|nr:zinc carboxypeptidase [Flavisolibacter sp.]